ncbi:hypothetical protein V1512DRAFT_276239 [Lipomyces arxii]|uniref:uncharacterized protein n=1 Tax=Lipomyces arxii TaxID=56418 RepID=UPI0034CE7EFF
MFFQPTLRVARLALKLTPAIARVAIGQVTAHVNASAHVPRVLPALTTSVRFATTATKTKASKKSATKPKPKSKPKSKSKPKPKAKKPVKKPVKKVKAKPAKWPIRPRTVWSMFLIENMKHRGQLSFGEAIKNAKSEYEQLTSTQLTALQEAVKKDKVRYDDEVVAFYKEHGVNGVAKTRRATKTKTGIKTGLDFRHPEKPKKPINAYGFFLQDTTHAPPYTPGTPIGERGKELATAYKALPAGVKEHYAELAASARETYAAQMVHFNAKFGL